MRKECMSLRDFNIDGKMMNKTFDTFCSRNYPKQIFSKTHGQLVGMHDENVFGWPFTTRTKPSKWNASGLTHPTWEFCRKSCFEARQSRADSWSLLGYKELNLTKQPLVKVVHFGLLFQIEISASEDRSCAEIKVLGLKSDTAVLLFSFPPSLFFRLSWLDLFLFLGIY